MQDAAALVREPITMATYGRLIEYDTLIAVHTAWQADDKGHAQARVALAYPDMYDVYAMILLG